MKKRMRMRCTSFILALAMLVSLRTVNVYTAKAQDYIYGSFAVTALTGTSVTVDYRNLYYDMEGLVTISGWKVRVTDELGNSQDMQTAAPNQVIYTISGLTPGIKYTIAVMMLRTWFDGESDEGYAFVSFVTPMAGTAAVDVVTETSVIPTAPTTPTTQAQTPYVPSTPYVDTPYTTQTATPSVKQPKIKTSKCKIKKNSIFLKWGKVKNASSYTIYIRKEGKSKWNKVKKVSASKTSYKITKYKGKKLNLYKQDYEVTVMATAKMNGKLYNSSRRNYIRTYTYYY